MVFIWMFFYFLLLSWTNGGITEALKGYDDEKKKMKWEEKWYFNAFAIFRKTFAFAREASRLLSILLFSIKKSCIHSRNVLFSRKLFRSPEKLCIQSQNFYFFSQNFCVYSQKCYLLAKLLSSLAKLLFSPKNSCIHSQIIFRFSKSFFMFSCKTLYSLTKYLRSLTKKFYVYSQNVYAL